MTIEFLVGLGGLSVFVGGPFAALSQNFYEIIKEYRNKKSERLKEGILYSEKQRMKFHENYSSN